MTDSLELAAKVFSDLRPRLFGIAYRILGSAAEADDVLQDVWLRWQSTDRSVVRDATAFLTTATTRLAITVTQSARSRRETYVGQWLPEPVDTSTNPELGAETGEALELGILLLLEKLTPTERAAYVLNEAFDSPYPEIADALQITEVNARQLVSRARKHLGDVRRSPTSAIDHRNLLDTFLAAAQSGDLAALHSLLATDVVSYADGGGFVSAARRPVVGVERVAKMIARVSSWFWEEATITPIEANGRPAALLSRGGVDFGVLAISTSARGIDQVIWLLNPTKLGSISRASRAPS